MADLVRKLVKAGFLAEQWEVAPATIYRLAASGELPCVRLSGRVIRFDLNVIETWLQERAQKPDLHVVQPADAGVSKEGLYEAAEATRRAEETGSFERGTSRPRRRTIPLGRPEGGRVRGGRAYVRPT